MRPFDYFAAREASEAIRLIHAATSTARDSHEIAWPQYLAGGTTLLDLMKLDVMRPGHVVDINALAQFGDAGSITAAELRCPAPC